MTDLLSLLGRRIKGEARPLTKYGFLVPAQCDSIYT